MAEPRTVGQDRQGIGSALLRQAEQAAAVAGADAMWLTPWVHNHRALAFYARQGYLDRGAAWYVFEDERHENRVLSMMKASNV